jgi:hypothetical protein
MRTTALRHNLPFPLNEFGQVGASFFSRAGPFGFYSYRPSPDAQVWFCDLLPFSASKCRALQPFAERGAAPYLSLQARD